MTRRKWSTEDEALVMELRQIELAHQAAGEADRTAFREAWAAKMAGDLTPPPPPPVVCTIWLGYLDPANAVPYPLQRSSDPHR